MDGQGIRQTMKRAAATIALVLLTASNAAAQATGCSVDRGARVMLKSQTIDPDVLVWDRKDLMVAYASGVWPGAKAVLQHTFLSSPGTTAVAVSCEPAAIRPKYALAPQDAIAIRLVNGPRRGRYGWVASDDVHVLRPAAQRSRGT
ncbi:MAG TPA: hypothetical protein VN905_13900 [Candidatus Binatia bacterium]|nr:hypothetical protein [Candidatus Binatia bacterium]